MQTIPSAQVQLNLTELINQIIKNNERIKVASETGSVVILSESDWNALSETLRLLQDETSLKSLLEGHQARKKGQSIGKPSSEFFNEL